jgi:hypothetical protein
MRRRPGDIPDSAGPTNDAAMGGCEAADDEAQERGLPGAVGAVDRQRCAGTDLDVDVEHDQWTAPVPLAHPDELGHP